MSRTYNIANLSGKQLNYLVGIANGWVTYPSDSLEHGTVFHTDRETAPFGATRSVKHYTPSIDWNQGGVIIERESISLRHVPAYSYWLAKISKCNTGKLELWHQNTRSRETDTPYFKGDTPLIAAMRCYVAVKLGQRFQMKNGWLELVSKG